MAQHMESFFESQPVQPMRKVPFVCELLQRNWKNSQVLVTTKELPGNKEAKNDLTSFPPQSCSPMALSICVFVCVLDAGMAANHGEETK